jgi:hypothetical protein
LTLKSHTIKVCLIINLEAKQHKFYHSNPYNVSRKETLFAGYNICT